MFQRVPRAEINAMVLWKGENSDEGKGKTRKETFEKRNRKSYNFRDGRAGMIDRALNVSRERWTEVTTVVFTRKSGKRALQAQ